MDRDTLNRIAAIIDQLTLLYSQGCDGETAPEWRELMQALDAVEARVARTSLQ